VASPYSRGASFERKVAELLRAQGYIVYRSAGSHGASDLICLRARLGGGAEVAFVQAKTNGVMSPADRRALVEEARIAGAMPVIADRPKRGVIRLRRVLIDGYSRGPR